MKKKYPFVVVFHEQSVYGYFPDIGNIVIESDLVSTCLEFAEKTLKKELKKYKNENRLFPISNHISYYVSKKINFVTYIIVDL